MKKAILIWVGMLLLLIDASLTGLIHYPAYVPFDTPAPETVEMIIGHLIGDSLRIDLFSDLAGCLLILLTAAKIVNTNKKAFGAFAASVLALALYIAYNVMPFFLNGEARYVSGFFLYLVYILCKCIAAIAAGLTCCQMTECLENHAYNNVTAIFIILASSTGFIRGLCHFYNLPKTMWLYYGIELFFTAVCTVMFFKHRNFLNFTKA